VFASAVATAAEPAATGSSSSAVGLDPANAVIALTFGSLTNAGQPVAVRLVTALGAVQLADPVNPTSSVWRAAGAITGRHLRVTLSAGGGKTKTGLTVSAAVDGVNVSGTYTGSWNGVAGQGAVSGVAAPGQPILGRGPPSPLEWVKASYFGTPANDNFEGAAVGPDGALYLVGNAGAELAERPGGVAPARFGGETPTPLCGCGFVLKLSPDGDRAVACAQFGRGILHATALAVTKDAVFVVGFAAAGAAPAKDGLVATSPGGEDAWFAIVKWREQ
jgi:hypothetical protein